MSRHPLQQPPCGSRAPIPQCMADIKPMLGAPHSHDVETELMILDQGLLIDNYPGPLTSLVQCVKEISHQEKNF